jgi:uncharacterized protein YndB with AHSA1/START domain
MTSQINLSVTIKAPAKFAYEAFTNWQLLTEWFCDDAALRAHEGGHFFAAWDRGFRAFGTFVEVAPNKKLVINVRGSDESTDSQIDLSFSEQNGSTTVTLTHNTAGETWKRIWTRGLENLQSYLETGYDLRITRRPMIGIAPAELDEESAKRLGVPVTRGIYLTGLVKGMSAEKSGLLPNDVIVELDGKPVTDYASIPVAVGDHQAGDVVDVVYYRGGEKRNIALTFSPRPVEPIPATTEEFVGALEKLHSELEDGLRKSLEGATEEETTRRPAPTEWSARETIMHLLGLDRGYVMILQARISGDEFTYASVNDLTVIGTQAAQFNSTQEIVAELKRTRAEIVALMRAMPAERAARRGVFAFFVQQLMGIRDHDKEHFGQITRAIEAARQPEAVAGD